MPSFLVDIPCLGDRGRLAVKLPSAEVEGKDFKGVLTAIVTFIDDKNMGFKLKGKQAKISVMNPDTHGLEPINSLTPEQRDTWITKAAKARLRFDMKDPNSLLQIPKHKLSVTVDGFDTVTIEMDTMAPLSEVEARDPRAVAGKEVEFATKVASAWAMKQNHLLNITPANQHQLQVLPWSDVFETFAESGLQDLLQAQQVKLVLPVSSGIHAQQAWQQAALGATNTTTATDPQVVTDDGAQIVDTTVSALGKAHGEQAAAAPALGGPKKFFDVELANEVGEVTNVAKVGVDESTLKAALSDNPADAAQLICSVFSALTGLSLPETQMTVFDEEFQEFGDITDDPLQLLDATRVKITAMNSKKRPAATAFTTSGGQADKRKKTENNNADDDGDNGIDHDNGDMSDDDQHLPTPTEQVSGLILKLPRSNMAGRLIDGSGKKYPFDKRDVPRSKFGDGALKEGDAVLFTPQERAGGLRAGGDREDRDAATDLVPCPVHQMHLLRKLLIDHMTIIDIASDGSLVALMGKHIGSISQRGFRCCIHPDTFVKAPGAGTKGFTELRRRDIVSVLFDYRGTGTQRKRVFLMATKFPDVDRSKVASNVTAQSLLISSDEAAAKMAAMQDMDPFAVGDETNNNTNHNSNENGRRFVQSQHQQPQQQPSTAGGLEIGFLKTALGVVESGSTQAQRPVVDENRLSEIGYVYRVQVAMYKMIFVMDTAGRDYMATEDASTCSDFHGLSVGDCICFEPPLASGNAKIIPAMEKRPRGASTIAQMQSMLTEEGIVCRFDFHRGEAAVKCRESGLEFNFSHDECMTNFEHLKIGSSVKFRGVTLPSGARSARFVLALDSL